MQSVEKPGYEGRTGGPAPIRGVTRGDIVASLALVILAYIGIWASPKIGGGIPRGDSYLQFIPWFSFLGEQLRSGNIPGWNPYTFAGAPFAGDPQSGWMYLPSMVFFTLFSPVTAYTLFAGFHLILAGTTTFAFGRILGFGSFAAFIAAIAYQYSPYVEGPQCCSVRTNVSAWIPLALIGIELATRSNSWLTRIAWCGVSGIAVSQMLGGWLGQGAYYGLLVVGTYVLFRSLLGSSTAMRNARERVIGAVVHGAAILGFGFGFAAAGVLPRLEVVSRSMLAGGNYENVGQIAGDDGWHISLAVTRVLSMSDGHSRWYLNGAVFALAVLAPFVARRRAHMLYFALLSLAIFVLTTKKTAFHELLYLLPEFEVLHTHVPSRALVAFFIGPAMLAGATIDTIVRPAQMSRLGQSLALLPSLLIVGLSYWLTTYDRGIDKWTILAVCAVSLLLLLAANLKTVNSRYRRISRFATNLAIPLALSALILWQPSGDRIASLVLAGESVPRFPASLSDLPCLDRVEGASRFLRNRGEEVLYRYFGHDSEVMRRRGDVLNRNNAYHQFVYTQPVQALLVGNQSTCIKTYDIQGYNPVQNARYVEYMLALNNGVVQEYHASSVLTSGIRSPLLNALGARYIIIPADFGPSRPDLFHLVQRFPQVYVDDDVTILENLAAFPRAWIVHEAAQVSEGEALAAIASESIDLREVAVLETVPPGLAPSMEPSMDTVSVEHFEPDRIQLSARTDSPGLVVLSEIYDPAWKAYIDGEEVDLLVANHALMAVPIPAGDYKIEIRYESLHLQIGLLISGGTTLGFLGLVGSTGLRHVKGRNFGYMQRRRPKTGFLH